MKKLSVVIALGLCVGACSADRAVAPTAPTQTGVPRPSDPAVRAMFDALKRTSPFTKKVDAGFRFDRHAAELAHLSPSEIAVGENMAVLATQALRGESLAVDKLEAFRPFFLWIGEENEISQEAVRGGLPTVGTLSAAPHVASSPSGVQVHCPPRYYLSVVDANGYLLSRGYHVVPSYAGGGYAKFITTSHWPASTWGYWTYRNQAVVWSSNHSITFQDVEPNPELAAYSWWIYPGPWWGPFVVAWHQACN